MGIFDAIKDSYSEHPDQAKHSASLTHELLAGAVAYQAASAYEKHVAKNGKPDNHAQAKEILAGFIGAAVDHIAETRVADAVSAHQRKSAREKAEQELGAALVGDYN